ncbi:MAG: L,D-transpeptidase family protein [Sphingomonas sp.]|nr:L,D-transpeptidase family protein [Sphingomonas sp.]
MAVGLSAEEAAAVGNRPVKSLLKIDGRMRHGDFKWNDQGVGPGPVWVRVDLQHQMMSVFRNGEEIGTAVILFGARSHGTPVGTFPILARIKDHHSSTYDAPMPYTLRLTGDGVAIHGSEVRWGAATHGCIGVPTKFAERLFDAVKVGVPVVIVDAQPAAAI